MRVLAGLAYGLPQPAIILNGSLSVVVGPSSVGKRMCTNRVSLFSNAARFFVNGSSPRYQHLLRPKSRENPAALPILGQVPKVPG